MACNSVDGCCAPPMCANAGSQLNCIFNDIGTLIKPFTQSINQRIAPSKPKTVAGSLGSFSNNQLLVIGVIVFIIILVIEHK